MRKLMKYSLVITLLAGAAMFSSCGGTDELPNPDVSIDPADLIGQWRAVSQAYFNCPDPADDQINPCGSGEYCVFLTFNEDGTVTEEDIATGASQSPRYTTSSGSLSTCLTYMGCEVWAFSVIGNELLLQQISGNDCSETLTFTKVN